MTRIPKDYEEDDGGNEDEYPCVADTYDYQQMIDRLKRNGEIESVNEEY
jgi:hypothetical protein